MTELFLGTLRTPMSSHNEHRISKNDQLKVLPYYTNVETTTGRNYLLPKPEIVQHQQQNATLRERLS